MPPPNLIVHLVFKAGAQMINKVPTFKVLGSYAHTCHCFSDQAPEQTGCLDSERRNELYVSYLYVAVRFRAHGLLKLSATSRLG